MKNIFKYAYSLLAGVVALTAVSCSDKYEYDGRGAWDAAENYADVYFPTASASIELDPVDPTTATIAVKRKNTAGALSVSFEVTKNTDNVFEVGKAEFADGADETTLTVNFPKAEVGTPYKLQVVLNDPAYVSKYSKGITHDFSVTRVKWNDAGFYYDEDGNKVDGYAMYTDDMVDGIFSVSPVSYPVKCQERADMPGVFRIYNPYGEIYPYNEPGDWDDSKDYLFIINASDPSKVYFDYNSYPNAVYDLGIDYGYGMMRLQNLAGYYLANNKDASKYYGTYANGAITFPKESFYLSMANYKDGAWNFYGNPNGQFKLVINPDLDLYTASIAEDDFAWEKVFTGTYMSAQLGVNTPQITLYKGIKKDDVEEANPGCYKRFEDQYGTVYKIAAPYAKGFDLVFCVKGDEVVIPEGYESQPLGFKGVGYDIYGAIAAGGSTFTADKVDLKINFQDKSGKVAMGTAVETLLNFIYTEDMVMTNFKYTAVAGGESIDLGAFSITKNEGVENGIILNDFVFEGAKVKGTMDLSGGKIFVEDLSYIGTDQDGDGNPIYVFTANEGDDERGSIFNINIDGTMTSKEMILVYSPDLENLYYYLNCDENIFTPVKANASRHGVKKHIKKSGKFAGKLSAKKRNEVKKLLAKRRH